MLVVGIRSIGTTLGAMVAETLSAGGWSVRRRTLRPEGGPFDRRAALDAADVAGIEWALVVDEGPGLSGSSMAAVAEAMARAGLGRDRIAFLPGHAGEPGQAASESTRAWWASVPRYPVSLDDLRWDGATLYELFGRLSSSLSGTDAPVERLNCIGGGLWRNACYPGSDGWPAVCGSTERAKYLCRLPETAVLWRYTGMVGRPGDAQDPQETALADLSRRAAAGWTAAPIGAVCGFIATPWIEGTPLTRADASPEVLDHLARYVVGVAGPPLPEHASEDALARLSEMLITNTREAFGDDAAERAKGWCDHLSEDGVKCLPSSGDARLAPHEWVRTPDGRLLKPDSLPHDMDHTIVGAQPCLWDVAGALVEWDLSGAAEERFLDAVRRAGGPLPSAFLALHRLAYAAFRMGQCVMCRWMTAEGPAEQQRLDVAAAFYRGRLEEMLAQPSPSRGATHRASGHPYRSAAGFWDPSPPA